MAKVKLNPMFEGISKSLGDITYRDCDVYIIAGRKNERTANPTEGQLRIRELFRDCANDWSRLPESVRKSWKLSSKGKRANGYQHFCATNVSELSDGRPLRLCIGTGTGQPSALNVTAGASGAIVCNAVVPSGAESLKIVYAVRKQGSEDTFQYHCVDAAASSLTVDNLEPGAAYDVHAMICDKEIDQATRVSSSVYASTAAGI